MTPEDVVGTPAFFKARFLVWATVFCLIPVGCSHRRTKPLTSEAPVTTNCDKTTGYDVIIVGAGLSGLTAAKELRRNGLGNVLILEATDRIGGRALTLKDGPPIDLGGAWIHGVLTNPLTGIADAMDFDRVKTHLHSPVYIDNGVDTPTPDPQRTEAFEQVAKDFEARIVESARRQRSLRACHKAAAKGNPPDAVCEALEGLANDQASAYLPQDSEYRQLLAGNAGPLESATELENSSTTDVGEFEAADDDLLTEGMGTFVEAYGEGQPVCLSSPVTKITYREDGVVLEVKGGKQYWSRLALVTVSTGVLKARKIQFDPPLPDSKQQAIEGLPMGFMQKVIIAFKGEQSLFGDTPPNSWVLYQGPDKAVMSFVIRPLGKNIAIGFYGGTKAQEYEAQCVNAMGDQPLPPRRQPCDEQAVQRARTALQRMYGSATLDLASAVDQADIYVTRWSLEPWTLGAYSAAKPNAWPMREELAKPVRYYTLDARTGQREEHGPERLHFAGEATALLMYNGSFAGAYESGMRAAREMLELLDKEDSSSRGNPSTKSGPGSSLDRIQRGLQPGHARVPASL
jgi:monoamine oxidase